MLTKILFLYKFDKKKEKLLVWAFGAKGTSSPKKITKSNEPQNDSNVCPLPTTATAVLGGLNFWGIRMAYLRLPRAIFLMKNYFINSPSFIAPNWSLGTPAQTHPRLTLTF